jgi:leucyl/phenylalanyl-tRNA--protein transferase
MVLFPAELKVSRSLQKTMRRAQFEVRTDTAFEAVMRACAAPRQSQSGTWISEQMIAAYTELHRQGFAHSVETWREGELVGGLYGVAIGRIFYGESMFSRVTDASKIAFVSLVNRLLADGFGLIDCQMRTAHLASLGAREIPRAVFSQHLAELTVCSPVQVWR